MNGCAPLPGDRIIDSPTGPLEISETDGAMPAIILALIAAVIGIGYCGRQ